MKKSTKEELAKLREMSAWLKAKEDGPVNRIFDSLLDDIDLLERQLARAREGLNECRDFIIRREGTRGVAYFPARETLADIDAMEGK